VSDYVEMEDPVPEEAIELEPEVDE